MNKIVVFSPHSDDETLGAGGYLLKHRDMGDEIYWVNVTNAKTEYGYSEEETSRWNEIIGKVNKRFDFVRMYDLGLEPAALDRICKSVLIKKIKDCIEEIKPNIVLIPYFEDTHSDHRIVFESVMACCKSFRSPVVEKILCMEIISETDYAISTKGFIPNYFVDITDYLEKKLDIMRIYDSEISSPRFPRSIEAIQGLAITRGAASFCRYAEAFLLIKQVER